MKLNKPKNQNYCATVVQIKDHTPLQGRDRIVHSSILGAKVIISNETPLNTIGVYLPVETQLSELYCHNNNLYSDKSFNLDKTKGGFIDISKRRIRCLKLGGFESNGLFMALDSLKFCFTKENDFNDFIKNIKIDDEFDELNSVEICKKYEPVQKQHNNTPVNKRNKKIEKQFNKLIKNQFNFHIDTSQLSKNIHKLNPNNIIQISSKWHGTSSIFSNILTKRKLNWIEKLLLKLKVRIETTEYGNIYASRSVIKNNVDTGFYGKEDIWKIANDFISIFLDKGLTVYAEIVGYLPSGKMIQKDYDYGFTMPKPDEKFTYNKQYGIRVYRVTYTNPDGIVFEFSTKQVQDWCKDKNLIAVKEFYYGYAKDLVPINDNPTEEELTIWRDAVLDYLKRTYLEKDCPYCKTKPNTPDEGIVLRIEDNIITVFKYKSFRFLKKETEQLDELKENEEVLN